MSNNKIDILNVVATKFGTKVQIEPGHLSTGTIIANNGLHRDVLKTMIEADEKTGIIAITGLDLGANIGVYYHVRATNAFVTIKAEVPKENPKIQTIVDIHPGALFHELEVADLLGVIFEGNPTSGHFVLSENWPEGIYPLRKDVKANQVKLVPTPASEKIKLPENERLVKIIKKRGQRFWLTKGVKPPFSEPFDENFNCLFNKIYFDMAGAGAGWIPGIEVALLMIRPDRICFGTDYPYDIHTAEDIKAFVDTIKNLNIPENDKRLMLGENIKKLFKVK